MHELNDLLLELQLLLGQPLASEDPRVVHVQLAFVPGLQVVRSRMLNFLDLRLAEAKHFNQQLNQEALEVPSQGERFLVILVTLGSQFSRPHDLPLFRIEHRDQAIEPGQLQLFVVLEAQLVHLKLLEALEPGQLREEAIISFTLQEVNLLKETLFQHVKFRLLFLGLLWLHFNLSHNCLERKIEIGGRCKVSFEGFQVAALQVSLEKLEGGSLIWFCCGLEETERLLL